MIKGYKDKKLVKVAETGKAPKGFPSDLLERTTDLLLILDAAAELNDLRSPPGNRLEALVGDREGQHSIRVNKKFRICFVWTEDGPDDVEFVDYH